MDLCVRMACLGRVRVCLMLAVIFLMAGCASRPPAPGGAATPDYNYSIGPGDSDTVNFAGNRQYRTDSVGVRRSDPACLGLPVAAVSRSR